MSLVDPATQQQQLLQQSSAKSVHRTGTVTPPFQHLETPQLSSSDTPTQAYTPHLHLQTPVGPQRRSITVMEPGMEQSGEMSGFGAADGLGLGYGLNVKDGGRLERAEEISDVSVEEAGDAVMRFEAEPSLAPSAAVGSNPAKRQRLASDPDELVRMRDRFTSMTSGDGLVGDDAKAELVTLAKAVLNDSEEKLAFAQAQLEAQRDTIVTLQEQSRLAGQLQKIERDRFAAERASWQAETRALVLQRENEIASGARPRGVLDLDVGYHQALEAANKRLEMDNQLMAPRLADTSRQIDKLVHELKYLRSHVILPEPVKMEDEGAEASTLVERAGLSALSAHASSSKINDPMATMGDARAEHILLAAQKVRAMRAKDNKIGRLSIEELRRGGVVGPGGGLGYSEGYGEDYDEPAQGEVEEELMEVADDDEELGEDDDVQPVASKGKSRPSNSLLPRPKRAPKVKAPPTTPKTSRTAPPPTTTPGGSNFNDLLRAAELADRPTTPTSEQRGVPMPLSAMSATRSTTLARDRFSETGSPSTTLRWGGGDIPDAAGEDSEGEDEVDNDLDRTPRKLFHTPRQPGRAGSGEHEESALDILAQASQLDASQEAGPSQLQSASRLGGVMEVKSSPLSTRTESALAPAIDLRHTPTGSIREREPVSDRDIDPVLSRTPRLNQTPSAAPPAVTPKSHKRRLSTAVEFATPSRKTPASSQETPYDDSPSMRSPPSSVARSESLALDAPFGAYASPTGGVPGLGRYVHLTSNMPARRVRSPYLKWTLEEDELLARAVALHGEKWDLVSKGVPTRSYHQVRQRWLRKTGAFDKKMPSAEEVAAAGHDRDDEPTSPTPMGGKTPVSKKRKV